MFHCSSPERLQRHLVERFIKILQNSQHLELNSIDGQKTCIENLNGKLNEVDAAADQELFINLNIRTFVAPEDWKFEPSPIHYDTVSDPFGNLCFYIKWSPESKADMNKDPVPKIVLQNKARRSKEKLVELDNLMDSSREWH